MRKIPTKLRAEIAADPYMSVCARGLEGNCSNDITWEHAWINAGKQVNEKWAIIPLCSKHHGVNMYQDAPYAIKEINHLIALNRADDETITRMSKARDLNQYRDYLRDKYPDYA